MNAEPSLAGEARALCLKATRGSLATRLARDDQPGLAPGTPHVSLVLVAWDLQEGLPTPLLLLSDLADHTRNLKADGQAALLLDGTAGFAEPLAGPRVSLLGQVSRLDAEARPAALERFVAVHPGAKGYAGFPDFNVYRLWPAAAHFVAGFGRIAWIPAAQLKLV